MGKRRVGKYAQPQRTRKAFLLLACKETRKHIQIGEV